MQGGPVRGCVLVTGASGQIGTRVCDGLRRSGHEVFAVDLNPDTRSEVEACDVRVDRRAGGGFGGGAGPSTAGLQQSSGGVGSWEARGTGGRRKEGPGSNGRRPRRADLGWNPVCAGLWVSPERSCALSLEPRSGGLRASRVPTGPPARARGRPLRGRNTDGTGPAAVYIDSSL